MLKMWGGFFLCFGYKCWFVDYLFVFCFRRWFVFVVYDIMWFWCVIVLVFFGVYIYIYIYICGKGIWGWFEVIWYGCCW